MERPFYMIYVQGKNSPTYQHSTIESAKSEARRLAEREDKEVIILKAVKKIKLNKFIETDFCDDIPF